MYKSEGYVHDTGSKLILCIINTVIYLKLSERITLVIFDSIWLPK